MTDFYFRKELERMAAALPKANCSCLALHDGESDRCGNCVFGACWCCTYPNDVMCRRHAPTATREQSSPLSWPQVRRSDWCGDYQRRTGPLCANCGSRRVAAEGESCAACVNPQD